MPSPSTQQLSPLHLSTPLFLSPRPPSSASVTNLQTVRPAICNNNNSNHSNSVPPRHFVPVQMKSTSSSSSNNTPKPNSSASPSSSTPTPSRPRVTSADPTTSSLSHTGDHDYRNPNNSNLKGFGTVLTVDEIMQSLHSAEDPLWQLMRHEASSAAAAEPQLASSLYGDILVHDTLEETLSTVLANALHTESFQATQWIGLFRHALSDENSSFARDVRTDISAFMQRDPATSHAVRVLLHAKGFQALQSWRLSNWLWKQGRISLAFFLQSMISSRFAVDIHPAATIGSGVLLDHGTGIVIGETASIGNNVSILHNVTLGGTGKESGDRHPKVGDGVMIGAGATILGNIQIGTCAHIAACSVVLKPVPPYSVISGVPAKIVGKVSYNAGVMPSFIMDQRLSLEVVGASNPYQHVVTGNVKATSSMAEDEGVDVGGGV